MNAEESPLARCTAMLCSVLRTVLIAGAVLFLCKPERPFPAWRMLAVISIVHITTSKK